MEDPTMTHIPANDLSILLIDYTSVSMVSAMPLRDPNDDDDEDEVDEDDEEQNDEPAVIREPDVDG
jgi:hypothetical protein